jgi:predicted GTPase
MEEYEPHINMGSVIYAGVDYGVILKPAQKKADVVVWDGGNNDMSFYKPDITVTVVDPLRAGHEIKYYPGEVNFRLADVIVVNKMDSADPKSVETILENIQKYNPRAKVIRAESVLHVDNPKIIKGKKVLVVEDGPTLTHGEMKMGAGTVAAKRFGAAQLADPRPYAVGAIKGTFASYPEIGVLLPAMGYGEQQVRDLEKTINCTECDAVVIATPIDLSRFMKINKPCTRVKYDLSLEAKKELKKFIKSKKLI